MRNSKHFTHRLLLPFENKPSFFDKEATINEFLKLYPDAVGRYSNYKQLYQDAVNHVGKISFDEKTDDYDDYFYLLSNQDKVVSIVIGTLAYLIAKETDQHGKDIEAAIDSVIFQSTGDDHFDVNNAFDTKSGMGHRMFGHDPATFAFKNIPTDYLIYVKNDAVPNTRKVIQIGEYLDVADNIKTVSMCDLIWKFYGNESTVLRSIWNCISHTIIHFAKDIFTPDGLPLPFTSLLETFKHEQIGNISVSVLCYRDSFSKKSKNMHLKASDFTSLATVEALISIYCSLSEVSKDKINGYKDDMKLIAAGTCIALQTSSLVFSHEDHIGKKGAVPIIDGGKINLPLITCYLNTLRKEAVAIYQANKKFRSFYKRSNHEQNN